MDEREHLRGLGYEIQVTSAGTAHLYRLGGPTAQCGKRFMSARADFEEFDQWCRVCVWMTSQHPRLNNSDLAVTNFLVWTAQRGEYRHAAWCVRELSPLPPLLYSALLKLEKEALAGAR